MSALALTASDVALSVDQQQAVSPPNHNPVQTDSLETEYLHLVRDSVLPGTESQGEAVKSENIIAAPSTVEEFRSQRLAKIREIKAEGFIREPLHREMLEKAGHYPSLAQLLPTISDLPKAIIFDRLSHTFIKPGPGVRGFVDNVRSGLYECLFPKFNDNLEVETPVAMVVAAERFQAYSEAARLRGNDDIAVIFADLSEAFKAGENYLGLGRKIDLATYKPGKFFDSDYHVVRARLGDGHK